MTISYEYKIHFKTGANISYDYRVRHAVDSVESYTY